MAASKADRILRVAAVAYGEKYTGYLNACLLKSIEADLDRLRVEGWTVELNAYPSFMEMLQAEVKASTERGAYTFFSGPDIIWARNSVYHMARQIECLDVAIAVPHFRVVDTFRVQKFPIDAPTLLTHALEQAHSTWEQSFDMQKKNQCHWGISARKVNGSMITMRHCIPTISMIKFRETDLMAFRNIEAELKNIGLDPLTQWDRGFLNKVAAEGRLKIVGSSDLACCVELTDPSLTNDTRENNFNDQHEYMRGEADFCRSTLYTMRLG